MVTFDKYLANLFENNIIIEETAILNSSDRSRLAQMLDKIKTARGEKVTNIEGLELDHDYERKGAFF